VPTVYGWHHLVKATEVTAGLAESNGSLLPGGWLKSHLRADCQYAGISYYQCWVTSIEKVYLFHHKPLPAELASEATPLPVSSLAADGGKIRTSHWLSHGY